MRASASRRLLLRRAVAGAWCALALGAMVPSAVAGATIDRTIETIARVKASVVAVGTFEATRAPPFEFRGTGFAVEDGRLIVTNAHVIARSLDPARREIFGILVPGPDSSSAKFREVRLVTSDASFDLALLAFDGDHLPPLEIGDSDAVREGQSVLFIGFPIGSVLGPYPATHRGMVSAITPIAIPQRGVGNLSSKIVRRIAGKPFPVFQLDATAYPGNSGSPLLDPSSGVVIGIINMVFVKGTKEAALRAPSGISYAIPSNHLKELLQRSR